MNNPPRRGQWALLWIGFVLFVLPGALRIYLLMPMPGSQDLNWLPFSYALDHLVTPLRIAGAAMMIVPLAAIIRRGTLRGRIVLGVVVLACVGMWYLTERDMIAQQMFREPQHVVFAQGSANTIGPESLVLGVEIDGIAKAYPVRLIAYHHKVYDTIGEQQILVTYCSVCRSGRVFLPIVDGRVQHFRLIGMQHRNAMFEDDETKSWWYQATGEAVIGPRTGTQLPEIHSDEMTLRAWMDLHPNTLVLQPDPASAEGYASFGFAGMDTARPVRSYFDSSAYAWRPWSWVIGVEAGPHAKAYAWSGIMRHHVVNDSLGGVPLAVTVEPDSITFHVWSRDVHGTVLVFAPSTSCTVRDTTTGSTWDCSGACVDGPLKGQRLTPLHAHREYWHSWRTFHPETEKWESHELL